MWMRSTISGAAVVLGATLLLGCPRAPQPGAPPAATADTLEWALIFYLPYDNDLDGMADRVIAQLQAETLPPSVGIAVQADRLDLGGQRRLLIDSSGVRHSAVDGEDSADVATLESFLTWASEELPARRYAVMLLGHGGALDHISVDWHPGRSSARQPRWMPLHEAADSIRGWSTALGAAASLELLYLQQCGRASVEDLYSVRDTATWVLASETIVGAPNTYYGPVLRRLAATPEMTGEALGLAVMESDEHTASTVLLRGSALGEMPRRVDALADRLLEGRAAPLRRPRAQTPSLVYAGESTYDLCAYVAVLEQVNGGGSRAAVDAELRWFREELAVAHRQRSFPLRAQNPNWCGVSFYVPATPERIDRYGELPLFRDSRWGRLGRGIAPMPVVLGTPDIQLPVGERERATRRRTGP